MFFHSPSQVVALTLAPWLAMGPRPRMPWWAMAAGLWSRGPGVAPTCRSAALVKAPARRKHRDAWAGGTVSVGRDSSGPGHLQRMEPPAALGAWRIVGSWQITSLGIVVKSGFLPAPLPRISLGRADALLLSCAGPMTDIANLSQSLTAPA